MFPKKTAQKVVIFVVIFWFCWFAVVVREFLMYSPDIVEVLLALRCNNYFEPCFDTFCTKFAVLASGTCGTVRLFTI